MKIHSVFVAVITGLTLGLFTAKADPTCYVVLDGDTSTNYYNSFYDAFHSIGTGTGTITMIANDSWVVTDPSMRMDVTGHVTIVSDGGDWTITRSVTNAFSMLYVDFTHFADNGITNAVLNLGAPGMPGTLTFDGGSFWNDSSSIILCYREGTLNLYDGVILKNNWSGYEGSGVYNEGVFNMYGGTIVSNKTRGWGGGVDNGGYWGQPAVFNMFGGEIAYNESVSGTNSCGGGLSNDGAATFNMSGGAIHDNAAELAGGGVFNSRGGPTRPHSPTFNMTGGTISGNAMSTTNGLGNGVFNDGALNLSADAMIAADNDVYLDSAVITVAGALNATGVVATVNTASTLPGTKVAVVGSGSGVTLGEALPFFALDAGATDALFEDSRLAAIVRSGPTCYVVMEGSGVTNYFADFAVAFHTIGTGTGTITMVADDVWAITDPAMTLDVTGHVTIVSDGGDWTITRSAANSRSMFYVNYRNWTNNGITDAVLNLGAPGMPGTLTIDGGLIPGQIASIVVNMRGTLNLYTGVTLKNNISLYGGAGVYNEQVFNMFGGSIVSNISFGQGGGVQNNGYWSGGFVTPVFNMYGGTIAYNQSLNDENDWGGYGGGIDNHGYSTFNMYGGSLIGNSAGFLGGGVANTRDSYAGTATGVFNMAGGYISGNTLTNGGNLGAGVYNDDVMTMAGSAQITADNGVYLDDNALITVAGPLTAPPPVAAIIAGSTNRVIGVVDVETGSGVTLEEALAYFGAEPGYDLVVDPFNNEIVRATPFEAWLLRRGHSWEDPDFFADEDIDGDGFTTWQEFVADTEPADGAEYFRNDRIGIKYGTNCWDDVLTITNDDLSVITVTQRVCEALGYAIDWHTASGRVYEVEAVTNLLSNPTWVVLTNFTATATTNETFFIPLNAWRDFIRLRVTRPQN